MHSFARRLRRRAATLAAAGVLTPTLLAAQTPQSKPIPGVWRFGASLYGYLPSVSGTSSAPADSGGNRINVDLAEILDLEFTVMGSFDAHNGRWGAFTDLVYLDFGVEAEIRDFTIGKIGIPANTTADLDFEFKGLVWTLAASTACLPIRR